jgi:hypothetical protein
MATPNCWLRTHAPILAIDRLGAERYGNRQRFAQKTGVATTRSRVSFSGESICPVVFIVAQHQRRACDRGRSGAHGCAPRVATCCQAAGADVPIVLMRGSCSPPTVAGEAHAGPRGHVHAVAEGEGEPGLGLGSPSAVGLFFSRLANRPPFNRPIGRLFRPGGDSYRVVGTPSIGA